ncbi:cell envelope integrity EipB family protein [Micavibrio aeruginosavorus]|nr:cell envelope integrity EipB family protein [Micavibrio aeruginosavorus]
MMRIWTLILLGSVAVAGLAAYGAVTFLRDVPGAHVSLDDPVMGGSARNEKPSKPAKARKNLAQVYKDEVAAIVPHKAIYNIEMVERRSGSQVLNISGQMYFELKKTCDAWISDHRFNMLYEYADTPPMRITSDFATYEQLDGDTFDFTSRRRRDGTVFQELRGRATVDSKGGKAVFSKPGGLDYRLSPDILFPMGHTLATLKAARDGKTFLTLPMFDGSDEEGPVDVSVFIGKKINAMDERSFGTAVDPTLVNTPAWRMHLAFFPQSNPEPQSDYEMDAVFHDNGMISHMYVTYDEFSVTQSLVALEKLPVDDCGQGGVANGNGGRGRSVK